MRSNIIFCRKIFVLLYPDVNTSFSNPYIAMLAKYLSLREDIVGVGTLSFKTIFSHLRSNCIIHFQWIPVPEYPKIKGFSVRERVRLFYIHIAYLTLLFLVYIRKLIFPTRVIWTLHDRAKGYYIRPALMGVFRILHFHIADGYIMHADEARNDIPILYKKKPMLFCDRPNFIGQYGPIALPEELSGLRQKLGVEEDAVLFLLFGRIRRYKNIEKIIQAFCSARFSKKARLLIVGAIHDKDAFESIKKLIEKKRDIVLLPEIVPAAYIRLLFGIADYVLIAQERGYTSGVMFTAMSYAKPVIILRWAAALQYVRHGKNGFLFDWKDLPRVLEIASQHRNDIDRYNRMCKAALETMKPLTWEKTVEKITSFYHSLWQMR